LKYARVSVYFQDIVDDTATEDGYTVVPGSQLVVTRTAHKDNTSSYYVDGKKMSADEVTTLLRKRGIDLDNNRFLILQGEVEQIAMMKPKAQVRTGAVRHEEGMARRVEPGQGAGRDGRQVTAAPAMLCVRQAEANTRAACTWQACARGMESGWLPHCSALRRNEPICPPAAPLTRVVLCRMLCPQTPHEEGLLEYLEDIIGSNAYVEQIGESSKVVEALTEQRAEKLNRVKLVEREKAGLEGSKGEAEALLSE
jgi:hypothetical protein